MAIDKQIWDKAKALFELGYTLQEIELETEINKSSISKKAKKEKWEKSKNQQLKSDIIEWEEENSKQIQQKSKLVEKMSKLSDFEITILDEVIQEEARMKTLITSTASLALIRTNQMLTKNQTVEKINVGDGMQQFEPRELNATDLKNISDTIDKLSITTNVNERHAKSQVNIDNTNAMQNNIEENQITISIKD